MVALEQQAQLAQRLKHDGDGDEEGRQVALFGSPDDVNSAREADFIGSAEAPVLVAAAGLASISALTAALIARLAALSTTSTKRKPMPNVNAASGNFLHKNGNTLPPRWRGVRGTCQLTKDYPAPHPGQYRSADESALQLIKHRQQMY